MKQHRITLPFTDEALQEIRSGDQLLLTGTIYAARDEAHKRLIDLKNTGKPLPADFKNALIYYVGPAPAKPGQAINSAGPTTAKRMDAYTADMLDLGVRGMIGKGERGEETKKLLKERAIYMAVLGGVAAKQAKTIKKQEILAFEDAGMEALRKFEVEDFPVIVINDIHGNDAYVQ